MIRELDKIRESLARIESEACDAAADLDAADKAVAREHEMMAADRRAFAAEMEPIFGAVFRGGIDDARARLAMLPALLGGDDPLLLALQRAKSNPALFAA